MLAVLLWTNLETAAEGAILAQSWQYCVKCFVEGTVSIKNEFQQIIVSKVSCFDMWHLRCRIPFCVTFGNRLFRKAIHLRLLGFYSSIWLFSSVLPAVFCIQEMYIYEWSG